MFSPELNDDSTVADDCLKLALVVTNKLPQIVHFFS